DSRLCISYHTIENRGEIPEDLARDFGDWVFGCDICQDVCPWNRRPVVTTEADFQPRDGNVRIALEDIEGLDEAGFRERFAGSPIARAKYGGLLRNARIV